MNVVGRGYLYQTFLWMRFGEGKMPLETTIHEGVVEFAVTTEAVSDSAEEVFPDTTDPRYEATLIELAVATPGFHDRGNPFGALGGWCRTPFSEKSSS